FFARPRCRFLAVRDDLLTFGVGAREDLLGVLLRLEERLPDDPLAAAVDDDARGRTRGLRTPTAGFDDARHLVGLPPVGMARVSRRAERTRERPLQSPFGTTVDPRHYGRSSGAPSSSPPTTTGFSRMRVSSSSCVSSCASTTPDSVSMRTPPVC